MTETARIPTPQDFAAATDWWREAGLDNDFGDDVTDWLAAPNADEPGAVEKSPAPPPQPAPKAPSPEEIARPLRFGGDESNWPDSLENFARWWLRDSALELGGTGPRIAPRGTARPSLMIVVAHPEEQDRDTLLSGPEGQLLIGFLRAADIAASQAYFASLLPRFTAAPDWSLIEAAGAAALLEHHIALVEPDRILVLGRNIPPLLGHAVSQEGKSLPRFNHKGRSLPFVEGQGLARMLRSAAVRRDFWHSWLDGTNG